MAGSYSLESEALKRPLAFYAISGGCVGKSMGVRVEQTWVLNLVPPLTSCAALHKLLNFPEFHFPYMYNRIL